jgi:hypothetical protein
MGKMTRRVALACVVLACVSTNRADAGFTTSQSAFLSANPGLQTLTFEGIAPSGGDVQPAPSFAASGVTFTTPDDGPTAVAISSSSFFFNTPSDALFVNQFNEPLDMNFTPNVGAVGFNVAAGFGGGSVTVDVFNGATLLGTTTFSTTSQTDFTTFIGASGFGPITEVTVTPGSGLFVLIDNLSFGTAAAVPEPSSLVLCGMAGAIGLVVARVRRKRAV